MELTQAQKELANILLLAFPAHTAVITLNFYSANLLIGKDPHYSEEFIREMRDDIMRSNSPFVFLLDEGYLRVENYTIGSHILTEKGKKAKNLGGINAYKSWESEEERKKRFEEFPKKKWHIYDAAKWLIFFIIGAAVQHFVIEPITKKNEQTPSQQQTIIHKSNTGKSSPVSLNKKDSV